MLFDSGFSGSCSMPMEPYRHRYSQQNLSS
jgi:hypothetical protein